MIPTKLMTRDEITGELRPLTNVEAAPLIACLRAGAKYEEIDAETYMLLAWICLMWERTGQIPKGALPKITMPATATVPALTPASTAPGQIAPGQQPIGLTPGARVRTAEVLTMTAEQLAAWPWSAAGPHRRRPGALGTMAPAPNDGPISWVRHDDGTEAPYDRDELTVIEPTPATLTREEAENALRALAFNEYGIACYLDHPREYLTDGTVERHPLASQLGAILRAFVAGEDARKAGGAK